MMGVAKAIGNIFDLKNRKQLARCEDVIVDYIYEPSEDLLSYISRNSLVKERIVSLVSKTGKGIDENIRTLYRKLGFYSEDIKLLQNRSFRKRLYALVRLIALREKIPRRLHLCLLHDSFDAVKWQAMSFYIDIYGKEAFSKLVAFMDDESNLQQAGLVFYLVSEYIYHDQDMLLPLLERVQGEKLKGVLFKVLELFPQSKAEETVFNLINDNSSVDSVISSIKVTMNNATKRSFIFYEIMSSHRSGPVRMFVAKALALFSHSASFEVLRRLATDKQYLVKQYACQSLIKHNTHEANSYLRQIFKDRNHPAYQILKNEYIRESFKEENGI